MMMIGSKDHMGSFEQRSRTQDTIEGPISEAYIHHWFQEEFLRLFEKDLAFREQVLKCLLTGDDEEGNDETRKPRRTWFNGIGETHEVSCEEARYRHLRGETTCIGSDMSSEAAGEKCHSVLNSYFATYEQPSQRHLGEKQKPVSLEPVSKGLFPSTTFNTKDVDKNQSGILILGDSKVNYHLPGAGMVTSSPLPSRVSGMQHQSLQESLTGPCVRERGTQTWKANPLYLHSNSDTDSNDSWQHEGSSKGWMNDLENGRMLHEINMRKVNRLEESRPSRKVEGLNNWREHLKGVQEICMSSNTQVLPHYIPEDGKAGVSQRKKSLETKGTGHLATDSPFRSSPSFICVMSEQTDEIYGTSCFEKNSRGNLSPDVEKSRILPCFIEHKDQATSCDGVLGNEVGDFTSASALAEHKRLHKDLVLKSPLIIVSQELPSVFFQENEKALLKRTLSEVPIPKHEPNGEVMFPNNQISGTQEIVLNENGKPKTLLESISLADERLTCEEESVSTAPSNSSSALLGKLHGNEEETQSLASSCPALLTNLDGHFMSLTEGISITPHCALYAQRERISPSGIILGSTKTLTENSIFQGQAYSLLSSENEQEVGEVTLNERNRRVHEETCSSSGFDEGERPALVGPCPLATCGSDTGGETTDSWIMGGGMLSDKKVLSPGIFKASRLAAIDEEEQVVDAPKSPHDLNVSRPTARRAAFKPAKDIHWLPPKRNIQYTGIQRTSGDRPFQNVKRDIIKWDVTSNRPPPKAPRQAHGEEICRHWEDQMRNHSSSSHRKRIQMWTSLLSKFFHGNSYQGIGAQRH